MNAWNGKAIGSNSRTIVLITCSPHKKQYHSTLNTLEFGQRCKGIERSLKALIDALTPHPHGSGSALPPSPKATKKLGLEELKALVEQLQRRYPTHNPPQTRWVELSQPRTRTQSLIGRAQQTSIS